MSHWTDLAEWRGPTPNQSGAMSQHRGLIIHIAEGSYEGTIAWQKNPAADVSSHFVVDQSGKIAQVVDTDITAWTQQQGNGKWLSSENAGFTPTALTAAQVDANAKLFARGHTQYGWPLRLASSPADQGLAFHALACATANGQYGSWVVKNTTGQVWGHCDCPGQNIINQLNTILQKAILIVNGGDLDMAQPMLVKDSGTNIVWYCDGQFRRVVKQAWLDPNVTGPITNSQVHQDVLLGNIQTGPPGNGSAGQWDSTGKIFISGGDMDVWGIDIATLVGGSGGTVTGPVDVTDASVTKIAKAVADEEAARLEN